MATPIAPGTPPAGAEDRPARGAEGLPAAPAEASAGVPGSITERKINLLRKRRYDAVHRGGAAARAQHRKGKLTARERIERLLDPGSFNELDVFAVHRASSFGMDERRVRGDGVVTGWGTIGSRQVFVFSHDASVFGGSLGEVFAEKGTKTMDRAMRSGCPCLGSKDPAGAPPQEGAGSPPGVGGTLLRHSSTSAGS